jgi:hypothetical protein
LESFLAIRSELLHGVAGDQQNFFRGKVGYPIVVVAFGNENFVQGVKFPGKG